MIWENGLIALCIQPLLLLLYLYNKNEIKSIKIENINFINFYTKEFKKGRKYNIPIIQILDRKKNIFAEMDIKTSDYILLKKYFKKYEVLIDDEFNKI